MLEYRQRVRMLTAFKTSTMNPVSTALVLKLLQGEASGVVAVKAYRNQSLSSTLPGQMMLPIYKALSVHSVALAHGTRMLNVGTGVGMVSAAFETDATGRGLISDRRRLMVIFSHS